VIHYRSFRNDDPPALLDLWNDAFIGRGAVRLGNSAPLDSYVFAKPYFDPAGLILALDDDMHVGFAHAGFGANATEAAVSTAVGVTCAVAVRTPYRRRGIGSELLRRCETYLTERGAITLTAGQHAPLNPFYFGLYGGSELPGFLASDLGAEPFLTRKGYQAAENILVFQRRLERLPSAVDGRFTALRKRYEPETVPRKGAATFWQECVAGPIDFLEFRLSEKVTGQMVARAYVWEMEGFRWRWNEPAVGIVHLQVREDVRRQGLGKLLFTQMLRQVQEQYFTLAEVQVAETNVPAVQLLLGLGFNQVDVGHTYRKP